MGVRKIGFPDLSAPEPSPVAFAEEPGGAP
jgi:hypothetical protein